MNRIHTQPILNNSLKAVTQFATGKELNVTTLLQNTILLFTLSRWVPHNCEDLNVLDISFIQEMFPCY